MRQTCTQARPPSVILFGRMIPLVLKTPAEKCQFLKFLCGPSRRIRGRQAFLPSSCRQGRWCRPHRRSSRTCGSVAGFKSERGCRSVWATQPSSLPGAMLSRLHSGDAGIARNSKRREMRADGVGNIGWCQMRIVLFGHPCVGMAELCSNDA
jgi:hypothetical protein